MSPADLIRQAQQLQAEHGNQSMPALSLYQKAIETCKGEDDEYELLYASYQCMWITSHLAPMQSVEQARNCLGLLQSSINAGAIMHFSEMGQFQQEVIRYATNCIAWNTFSATDNKDELDDLLELVSMGCSYADKPEHFYIFDTKARILLKRGRDEEAYTIIRSCLKKDRGTGLFNDLVQTEGYQLWNRNAEQGIVVDLNDDERAFLQKASRIHQRYVHQKTKEVADGSVPGLLPSKEIITLREAKKRFRISNYHNDEDVVLLLKGNVSVNGKVDNAWLNDQLKGLSWSNKLYGVVIDGDLTVQGDVVDEDALELYVTGDLTCNYLFSGDGIITVFGNATIKDALYGAYNDGSMDVYGKLNTPYIICYDHSMPASAEGEFIYMEGGHGVDRESIYVKYGSEGEQYYGEDCHKIFSPAVWDESDEFSIDNFLLLVRSGENPFIKQ